MTPSSMMTPERIENLTTIYRDGLLNDTLPFWIPRCVDEEYGGFLFARDRDGTLLDTDKFIPRQAIIQTNKVFF